MFWTMKENGVVRMKVDNKDFLVTAPTIEDLNILSNPLKNWDITKQTLSAEYLISTIVSNGSTQPASFQHVGLKKMSNDGIHITNSKIILFLVIFHDIMKLMEKEGLTG